MKLRLLALTAGVALIAAAPVWAGPIKVDFGAGNLKNQGAAFTGEINYGRHGQYMKHVGFERRYGDQWKGTLGSDGAKWNTTDPWLGSSAPRGGDDKVPCDPISSTATPEPSTLSLIAMALVGLGLVARRHYGALRTVVRD